MKHLIVFTFWIGLFAVQANADMYTMDASTAAGMRLLAVSPGDSATLDYVGYRPGGPGDKVYGVNTEYGAGAGNMLYMVGFSGNMNDADQSGVASLILGLTDPGLSGTFDGFSLPIANGDDDVWNYRTYVTTGSGTTYSPWTVGVVPGSVQTLSVSTPGLDYSTLTGIGFNLEFARSLNGGRSGDDYSVSVVNPVPVPGALLLGFLGLSTVGMKLRKLA
jgi:hypothetical protein